MPEQIIYLLEPRHLLPQITGLFLELPLLCLENTDLPLEALVVCLENPDLALEAAVARVGLLTPAWFDLPILSLSLVTSLHFFNYNCSASRLYHQHFKEMSHTWTWRRVVRARERTLVEPSLDIACPSFRHFPVLQVAAGLSPSLAYSLRGS